MADLSDLSLPPSARPAQQQRPIVGALIAGYGAYINPAKLLKIEVGQRGVEWYVVAWLEGAGTGDASAHAHTAFLTPPFDDEEEARQACDALCSAFFAAFTIRPEGGAFWPGDVLAPPAPLEDA